MTLVKGVIELPQEVRAKTLSSKELIQVLAERTYFFWSRDYEGEKPHWFEFIFIGLDEGEFRLRGTNQYTIQVSETGACTLKLDDVGTVGMGNKVTITSLEDAFEDLDACGVVNV